LGKINCLLLKAEGAEEQRGRGGKIAVNILHKYTNNFAYLLIKHETLLLQNP